MVPIKILIVDDDEGMRFFLKEALEKEGYVCEAAANGLEALARLEAKAFPIVLMDVKMPRLGGLPALTEIKKKYPNLLVILMTAYGSKSVALEAIGKGAYDYFTKPFDLEEMRVVLKRAAERCRLQGELRELRKRVEGLRFPLIGESESSRHVMELIGKVAASDVTVLITGESGTGKEVVARTIHDQGSRSLGPFIPVNGAAIPEGLLEAELFGHEKGAFTGAHRSQPGKFELAHGGTLFLDEIGELKPPLQTKLLRILQDREVLRIGGDKPLKVDVRIIAATNKDLSQAVATGAFREDLLFRLNVFRIDLPPLQKRREDIPALTEHFLKYYSALLKKQFTRITEGARDLILAYHWPGNVRELENFVQRAVVLARGDCLDEALVREALPAVQTMDRHAHRDDLKARVVEASAPAEKRLIEEALRLEGGHREATARRLGISRKNLYNKMKRYGLIKDV